MSAVTDRIVAQVVRDQVEAELFKGARRGMGRVRGFTASEVLAIVEVLAAWAGDEITILVIGDAALPGLDARFRLPAGRSATWYRNTEQACVFIEAGDYGDRQGLRNATTLSDGDILGRKNPKELALAAAEVLGAAWAGTSAKVPLPELVRGLCGEVAVALHEAAIKPSLRRFVAFCWAWAQAAASQGIVDAEVARRTLGGALPSLGLFEDSVLSASSGAVPLERRICANALIATGQLRVGRELDADELCEQIARTELEDLDGQPLGAKQLAAVRKRMTEYLRAHGQPNTEGIEFHYWEQLLARKSTRKGVGTRVAEQIDTKAPTRRPELDELDVVTGLDARSPDAARRLLDAAGTDDDQPALVELIDDKLRRQIERIARQSFPAVAWPLRQLIRLLKAARDEDEDEGEVSDTPELMRVELRQRDEGEADLSASLFAFLYGATLTRVAHDSGQGWRLRVDARLTDLEPLRAWVASDPDQRDEADDSEDGEDAKSSERRWADLEIRLRRDSDQAVLGRFRWRREQFLGHLLTACACLRPEVSSWRTNEADFDAWVTRALETHQLGGGQAITTELLDNPLVTQLSAVRSRALAELARVGLDIRSMDAYVREWSGLLRQFRDTFVPTDASFDEVEALLQLDTVRFFERDEVALLATHPLRLRWIIRHFEHMASAIRELLRGTWTLNPINDAFYLDHLQAASPHAQPPILCDRSRVHVAVRENCWHEHYVVARDHDSSNDEWLAELDDASIDEMAAVVGRYVDAHPHKYDGLSILLLVRRGGTRSCQRFVEQVFGLRAVLGRLDRTNLTLHVIAARSEFGRVGEILEAFDDPGHRVVSDFPRLRVVLHEWHEDDPLHGLDALRGAIDLAIVPNLFTAHTRFLGRHRESSERGGSFKPWIDAPTSRSPKADRNAGRDLLPRARDEALDDWSTINVRHFHGSTVSENEGEGIDYFSVKVVVTQSEAFFTELHAIAHWVVTLDAFVGRNHIEALGSPPEIITTKPGLGKAGAHTLIVSSQVGRKFIVRRLARRLQAQLGSSLGVEPARVAELLYDRARELAPGTVLRALGLGRTAQELVGLVVSRTLVAHLSPAQLGTDGFEAWISLDAHQEWFRGAQGPRSDLLRLVAVHDAETLTLTATVVEAKLRESSAVRRAEVQVSKTCELLRHALASREQQPPADADVWRNEIIEAIDELVRGDRAKGAAGSFVAVAGGRAVADIGKHVRDLLLAGDYELRVEGVVCTMSLDGGAGDTTKTPTDEHTWIRASVAEVRTILEKLDEPLAPIAPTAPAPTAEPKPTPSTPPSAPPAAPPDSPAPEPGVAESRARGQSHEQLLARYQSVLSAFDEYGVEVRRDEDEPVLEGPGFYVFRVRPGRGVRPAKLRNYEEDLQYKLELPAGRLPRSYIDRGAVVFEVPKHESERYYIAADDLWREVSWPEDRLWVSIGEDVRGAEVSIDFSSNDTPHLLIGGITGSGKSVALETILVGLIRHYGPEQLQFSLIDPKGTELEFLRGDAHVDGDIGIYPDEALELLKRMVLEMERRFELMKSRRVRKLSEYNAHPEVTADQRLPWRLIVLDEYADLTSDRDDRVAIEQALQRLTQKARAAGIHVIVATQRPSAEVISTTVRANLGAQLALRVKTAVDSRIIMDETGAEALAGNGDAFLKGSGGEKVRLQCAKI